MFERFTTFLSESRIELKKVSWPSREETIRSTAAVIVISTLLALFLGVFDFLFKYLLSFIIKF